VVQQMMGRRKLVQVLLAFVDMVASLVRQWLQMSESYSLAVELQEQIQHQMMAYPKIRHQMMAYLKIRHQMMAYQNRTRLNHQNQHPLVQELRNHR